MSGLFQNKYRISSARLHTWNYGSSGFYFVTICTRNRSPFFGQIRGGIMCLSEIGQQVWHEWLRTIVLRADMNLEAGAFVVMPNHFHAILGIGANKYNIPGHNEQSKPATSMMNEFGPQSKNLASVMRGFKSAVTMYARRAQIDFGWQDRYHDHIIRSHDEHLRIARYIDNNIAKLQDDRFYFDVV